MAHTLAKCTAELAAVLVSLLQVFSPNPDLASVSPVRAACAAAAHSAAALPVTQVPNPSSAHQACRVGSRCALRGCTGFVLCVTQVPLGVRRRSARRRLAGPGARLQSRCARLQHAQHVAWQKSQVSDAPMLGPALAISLKGADNPANRALLLPRPAILLEK